MSELPLTGKVAAVTGASSGIGEATALALARAGASVSLAARREDKISALQERIEAGGGRALALATDVTREDEARSFVERTNAELGGLDILVNNAGLMLLGAVGGADTEEWRRMIDVNLLGLLYCTHAAFPIMSAAGGGHVVNVSSVAGRIASAGSAVYNLTKWGVGAFSEGFRQEAVHANIRVTIIEPGAVATELLSHNSDQVQSMAAKRFEGVVPLEADDIAAGILYAVTQPDRVAVNEILIRPAGQTR
jgi:NADP-dependent 3-hydroxy acid dehydrogenase YdfG